MRRLLFIGTLIFSSAGWASTPVGDFALLDHTGKFHQLSYYGDQRAIALVVQSSASSEALQALHDKYANQGVVVWGLNASDDRNAVATAHDGTVPILIDEAQLVAESLNVSHVGDALVIDPESMEVVFSGNSTQIGDALAALLAGSDLPEGTPGSGPALRFPAREQHKDQVVSYTKDIAPILTENCVQCHHVGGIGSWPMVSHAMVQGWSSMMREVLMTRRMPPGQIDTHVGKPIEHVAGLTTQEKQKLIHWIDAGSPVDGASDPLAALDIKPQKYTFGEPDMIVKVPAQEIPATGVIDYRYVPVELNLDRDVWVWGMEFVPGDRQVLHHVIAYVSSPADRTVRGRETGAAQGESVGGFAPGRPGERFRDNSGRLIRKGSNLLLQMHYTTSGRATVDETEIGIFIHDEPPEYVMSGGVAGQRRFLVPPGAKEHQLTGTQEIERDAYLYALMPHMHYRGKYMSYTAEYPDGRTELLLSVPKYDFNWQFNYQLAEPHFLPAGTKLIANGAMDNSDRNPSNPDPTKPVHFGLQTKHEMFFGFTTLRYVGETPANLVAKKNAEEAPSAGQ